MSTDRVIQDGVTPPTEHERKQILYWLKQIGPLTAWNRIFGFYQAWAQAIEECARRATESTGPTADYKLILDGLAHCEEVVLRLKKGDKRTFKSDASCELVMADRLPIYWEEMLFRMGDGETLQRDESNTPGWTQFHQTFANLCAAWGECALDIPEPRCPDTETHTFCDDYLRVRLNQMMFPNPLPDVPDPKEDVLVYSGKMTPYSDIWKSVDAPRLKLFSLFRNDEQPKGSFPIADTMSYLHGGSNASNMVVYVEERGLPITWRLLWHDTRYEDGTIPIEERDYALLKSDSVQQEASFTVSAIPDPLICVESGQPVLQAGRWLTENDLQASVVFQAGEILPMYQGRKSRRTPARAWPGVSRLTDGSVPAEEEDYVFSKPDPAEEQTLSVGSDAYGPLIWAESRQPAPQTDRWLVEHDLQVSITLQAGEILPVHQGRKSRWTLART